MRASSARDTIVDQESKHQELAALKQHVRELEAEIGAAEKMSQWPPQGFYGMYYATSGFMLGAFGAVASLLVNMLFAPLAGKSPLELIEVYLTFPMGEQALDLSTDAQGGLILTLGVCLYIGTGMLLGVPLYWVMVRICGKDPSLLKRMVVGAVIAVLLWLIAFYGVLSWFQPTLQGDNWITDPAVLPPWVAAGTHIVFGLTMALLYPLGQFTPYQRPTESSPG